MPKMKTRSAVKKRFKITSSGKIKRTCSNKNHILNKKSPKRKMRLRKGSYVGETQASNIKSMLPYA